MYFYGKLIKMKRFITEKLIAWKESKNRKPLLVRGARQTGKSWIINDFGKTSFHGNIHTINLEKRPDIHRIFKLNYDINRIISDLEIVVNSKIVPGRDLIFFDEIQECEEAILSLRYFYEDLPKLHVIAAGSLLEFSLQNIPFPVGRVQIMNMYPMTFYEFLEATEKSIVLEKMKEQKEEFSQTLHDTLNNSLKEYFTVGGMPECVKSFSETRSIRDVFEIQTDLLVTFRQDFAKYAGRADKDCLYSVMTNGSNQIGNQIKYSALAEGFSSTTIKNAFNLLETARIFRRIKATSPSGVPLESLSSNKKFKAAFLDIGLMSCINGISENIALSPDNVTSVFRGKAAEQFVAQELIAAGHSPYYWAGDTSTSSAEVDFLIEKENSVIPIEVKSGTGGRLRSLHMILDKYPAIKEGLVISNQPFSSLPEQRLVFLPLYMVAEYLCKK